MWSAFAFGTIDVGSVAVGLDLDQLSPSGAPAAQAAHLYLDDGGSVRFRTDGGSPSIDIFGGEALIPGDRVLVTSGPDLRNFKVVAGAANGKLMITYLR